MILPIVTYPDPRLKEKCQPVAGITDELRELARNMLATMYDAPGVGLAAPQVGQNIRLLVMDPSGKDEPPAPRILFNPVLTLQGEEIVSHDEGCLSVPMGYRADVPRHSEVRLEALDENGDQVSEVLDGFAAIVLQHEADHLDGLLFIDHISRLRRTLYDSKVKKWLKRKNPA